jgi:hypothetical protein
MNRVSTPLTKAHTTPVWAFLRLLVFALYPVKNKLEFLAQILGES